MINYKNKIVLLFISGLMSIVVYQVIIKPIIEIHKYKYNTVFNDQKYLWLFNDSVNLEHLPYHDSLLASTGRIRESDQNYFLVLEDHIYVEVFEFEELNEMELEEINFNIYGRFPPFENESIVTLNDDLGKEVPVVSIKNILPFNNTLEVGFSKKSKMQKIEDSSHYFAYCGKLEKMLLSNDYGNPLVLFDFSKVSSTLIVFYKTDLQFLIIVVTSENEIIDDGYINLFDFVKVKPEMARVYEKPAGGGLVPGMLS